MERIEALFGIEVIFLVFLLIMINVKGGLYDILKQDIDRKYKKRHTFGIWNGKITFSIPFVIDEKSKNEKLKKAAKSYNTFSASFWLLIILTIITYIQTN